VSRGQLDLFGSSDAPAPTACPAAEVDPRSRELSARLPPSVRFGTSSWSFPGWAGLVYGKRETPRTLARSGLGAYAQHPLLRTVGIDRTLYAPVEAEVLRAYADAVPEGFRFLVKAHEATTLPRFPEHPRYGDNRGRANRLFFDPAYAADQVVAPFVEGLGEKGGQLLFQLAPHDVRRMGGPRKFAEALYRFLSALPPLSFDARYAVEVRNPELLTDDYAAALRSASAVHCINALPRMPGPYEQWRLTGGQSAPELVVRWLLAPGYEYEEARARFAPFDTLAEPDVAVREDLAGLVGRATARGVPATVVINNKAEGCAPLSAVALAEAVVEQAAPAMVNALPEE